MEYGNDPSSVKTTNQFPRQRNMNSLLDMENLTIDSNIHHRTPSDVANNNDFEISITNDPSVINTMNTNMQRPPQMDEDEKTVRKTSTIKVNMTTDVAGNDEFCNVIVNIIDDDGNMDDGIWMKKTDEEYRDGAFSPKSSDSRTPRSKSNSLNSDQLMSHLR